MLFISHRPSAPTQRLQIITSLLELSNLFCLNLRSKSHTLVLRFPLAQHPNWFWCEPPDLVLRSLLMTRGMIDPLSNLLRIHPHKLLSLIQPLHLKLLLTNRTHTIRHCRVIWDREVLHLGILGSGCSGSICGCFGSDGITLDFTRPNPILSYVRSANNRRKGDLPIHRHTKTDVGLWFQLPPFFGGHGSANPCEQLSSSCLPHLFGNVDRIECMEYLDAHRDLQ